MHREQNICRRQDNARGSSQRGGHGVTSRARDIASRDIGNRGFTLVELMVTIVIIAILAGIVLVAARAAQQAANRANTQALIAKLHGQLMIRYESFRTRRLPINTIGLNGQQAALHRLNAIRELMRMELPDRYSDLFAYPNPNTPGSSIYVPIPSGMPSSQLIVARFYTFDVSGPSWIAGSPGQQVSIAPTAVNLSYQRKCANNPQLPSADYEDAECLYLILSTGLSDDTVAAELVNPANIGDTDADGMPEFIDAWGRPIRFIRWAPGFVSDFQPYDPVNNPTDPHLTAKNHDPFDPLRMQHPFQPSALTKNDLQSFPFSYNPADGMALVPLIYSLGGDGVDDIQHPPVDSNGFAIPSAAVSGGSYFWCANFTCYLSAPQTLFPVVTAFPVYDPYIQSAPPMPAPPPPDKLVPPQYLHLPGENAWRAVLSSAPSYPNNWVPVGAPSDTDGDYDTGGYADNITNHLLGQQ
ncbi:MAG TPA: prepilin-type N-terminal cleavage/methylation domain-containing protein [Pirellulales bacterium]|nr:prepilin-type N-terminal cleavage/methylation domain-containing protein [Pirellulales bacterium]